MSERPLRPFIAMMDRYRGWVLAGAILTLTTLVASIALLVLAGWFITASAIVGAASTAALVHFNYHYPSGGIRAFALTRVVSRYFERLTTHEATFRILAHVRQWFFARLIPLAPSQLASAHSGDALARVTRDIDALDNLYLRVLVPGLVAILACVMLLVFMGIFHPGSAAMLLIGLYFAGIVLPRWAERRGNAPGKGVANETGTLRTDIIDTVEGLPVLLSFGQAGRQLGQVRRDTDALLSHRRAMSRITGVSGALTLLISQGTLLMVVILGAVAYTQGDITGPILALLGFCALAAFETVMPLGGAFQYLGRTRAAARRLLEIAEAPPLVNDPPEEDRAALPDNTGLMLSRIRFTYPGAARPALDLTDETLMIAEGEQVAVMGPSGGGKSTLLALLLRLYDPEAGAIHLGGVPLTSLAQADLWSRVGYLSQRSDLFSATIRGNILIGRPDASEEDVRAAVEGAGLTAFVEAQPDGLETWVGDAGTLVSGGEARRIALARVLLKDPRILLLDEPTEGLDTATERDVMAALGRFAEGRTVIMVTHRDIRLPGMTRTIRIADGRIVPTETD